MRIIMGDLLACLADGRVAVIGHQVNAQGVMGAGLALQIRSRYPTAYVAYRDAIRQGTLHLGGCLVVPVAPHQWVAHLVGQDHYGRGQRHTDMAALETALVSLREWARARTLRVGLPFGLGAGLAGGDWTAIAALIERTLPDAILVRRATPRGG